jgi:hypothetical protein
MKTNNTHITANGETRGTITYTLHNGDMWTTEGNFQLAQDNFTVVMRKIGGRNRFAFITTNQIIDFVPSAKAGA